MRTYIHIHSTYRQTYINSRSIIHTYILTYLLAHLLTSVCIVCRQRKQRLSFFVHSEVEVTKNGEIRKNKVYMYVCMYVCITGDAMCCFRCQLRHTCCYLLVYVCMYVCTFGLAECMDRLVGQVSGYIYILSYIHVHQSP